MRRLAPLLPLLIAPPLAAQPRQSLDDYNPTWSTPGPDASASMPIGNGEVGLNLWTEPDGDILFYLSRTDAWSEACRLLKLARVRVSIDPPLVRAGRAFTQQLDLANGVIHLASSAPADACTIDVFVHPDHPLVYVAGRSETPRRVTVTLENWRTERTRLTGTGPDAELTSSWTMHDAPDRVEVWESADHLLDDESRLIWCHRNEDSIVPLSITHQGLAAVADRIPDPLLNRTFGGSIHAEPAAIFRRPDPTRIESAAPLAEFTIRIAAHTAQADSLDDWRAQTDALHAAAPATHDALRRTTEWWRDFWNRSYIFIDGDTPGGVPTNPHPITFGQDSAGGNRFQGELLRAGIYPTPFDDDRVFRLSRGRPEIAPPYPLERVVSFVSTDEPGKAFPNSESMEFPNGFTLEAWIKPDADLHAARIIDKVTPGRSDGFLFDIQPGATLRLIVADKILTAPGVIRSREWNRLAATYNPASDQLRIFVNGREVAASTPAQPCPSPVTRAYVLQRWVQACAGRGNYPIKFNGSIFTVDAKHTNNNTAVSPDYRRWGDCYWWQNTRLPYHPMLAAGDFEMMDPLFRMFADLLPVCEARANLYHNVSGAYFPETMNILGLYSNADYGWDRSGRDPDEVLCPWWQWAWNQGPELVSLMLDRYDYTQDQSFAREQLVPMATSVLKYFDTRFKRDADANLVISPTQSLETYWHNVVNDMPTVAGLHDITARLAELPNGVGSADDRALWQRIHDALPPIPTRTVDGTRLYAPAELYDPKRSNSETTELYHVFPHRLVGLASPPADIQAARETFRRRHDKNTHGWTQDGQFAALLGLTDEAQANILAKARNSNPGHRFPAMWGPNFDWLPDQTHGGNLMHVLQCMLLQPAGGQILLFPAWPPEWNVSFRLHAPRNTIIECDYRDGKVARLEVTPESRRADVRLMLPAN